MIAAVLSCGEALRCTASELLVRGPAKGSVAAMELSEVKSSDRQVEMSR
jgi:hypothetical protein